MHLTLWFCSTSIWYNRVIGLVRLSVRHDFSVSLLDHITLFIPISFADIIGSNYLVWLLVASLYCGWLDMRNHLQRWVARRLIVGWLKDECIEYLVNDCCSFVSLLFAYDSLCSQPPNPPPCPGFEIYKLPSISSAGFLFGPSSWYWETTNVWNYHCLWEHFHKNTFSD